MRAYYSCLILFLGICCAISAQTNSIDFTEEIANQLDAEIEEVLELWKVPGLAIAVVKKDAIIYERGFGFRDKENKQAVNVETLFPIASCSKAFTAALIGQIADKNKLDIEDNLVEHLPGLELNSQKLNNNSTIGDLLSQRSGLPAHNMSLVLFPPAYRDDILVRIPYLESSSGLRKGFSYSNILYAVLGAVSESCAGQDWNSIVRSELFDPLEMHDSNTSLSELISRGNYASGYDDELDFKKTEFFSFRGWEPAGGINSNVHEMANWMIAWLNGGRFKGRQVIPEDFVHQALSMQTIISSSVPRETGSNFFSAYGYGWMLQNYYGHYRADHQGGARGFSALTTIFPNDSLGIVVLTNECGSWTNQVVRDLVSNRILGLEYADLNKLYWDAYQRRNSRTEEDLTRDSIGLKITANEAEKYFGQFLNRAYGIIEIEYVDGELLAKFPENSFRLRRISGDIFRLDGISQKDEDMLYYMLTHGVPDKIEFSFGSNGEVKQLKMKLEPELESTIDFEKIGYWFKK